MLKEKIENSAKVISLIAVTCLMLVLCINAANADTVKEDVYKTLYDTTIITVKDDIYDTSQSKENDKMVNVTVKKEPIKKEKEEKEEIKEEPIEIEEFDETSEFDENYVYNAGNSKNVETKLQSSYIKNLLRVLLVITLILTVASCIFLLVRIKNSNDKDKEKDEEEINKRNQWGLAFILCSTLAIVLLIHAYSTNSLDARAKRYVLKLSTKEKIGQMFIVKPEALVDEENLSKIVSKKEDEVKKDNKDNEESKKDKEEITKSNDKVEESGIQTFDDDMAIKMKMWPVGGIIIKDRNIDNERQIRSLNKSLQNASNIPLFIALDEEGGKVSRVANNPNFNVIRYDSMAQVGQSRDATNAKKIGENISEYLYPLGFNLNLAPVCDMNTNPENLVIGNRAFSSNPDITARMSNGVLKGFHTNSIMGCIKHFPGYGDVKMESTDDYYSIDKTWDELKSCELIPFIKNFKETDMLMVAHVIPKNIISENVPATISKEMVTDKLRGELGYKGVVIAEGLKDGEVEYKQSIDDAAIKEINAGCDIVLLPEDLKTDFNMVLNAVASGEIKEERINESVQRIIKLKMKYNLIDNDSNEILVRYLVAYIYTLILIIVMLKSALSYGKRKKRKKQKIDVDKLTAEEDRDKEE